MTLRQIILSSILLLLSALMLTGCSDHDVSVPDEAGELHLRLHITQSKERSRGSYEFDPAVASDAEAMQSIRVVMVRAYDDLIIHNRLITLTEEGMSGADLSFKVDFATAYRIYLIANEAGIPNADIIFGTYRLSEGQSYPPEYLENQVMATDAPGDPLIDNSRADDDTPVPMTEMFEIETISDPAAGHQAAAIQDVELFVTRVASKFSFYLFRGTDVPGYFTSEITSIKISGLTGKEYLFPRDAVYSPEKYPLTADDRAITSFSLPDDTPSGEYIFALAEPLNVVSLPLKPATGDPTAGYAGPFAPQAYFTESKGITPGGGFSCTVSFDDGTTFLTAKTLPNLDLLPRDTHVKVAITIHADGLSLTAEVEPYTQLPLDPVFGL